MIVRLELNSLEKVILCTGDTATAYKLSDISLECDAIFDEPYTTTIGEMYTGTTSIPYTKLTSIHYQTLAKKDTTWKKFGLLIDTRSSTDNTLHSSGRAVEKSGILLQIEKAHEASNGDLTCYVFSLEDAVAHLSVTNPSGILTTEK